MTKLLEQAFEDARKLSDEDQDAVAVWLIAEISGRNHEDDDDFDRLIASRPDVLDRLEEQARAEIRAGKVQPMDFDRF